MKYIHLIIYTLMLMAGVTAVAQGPCKLIIDNPENIAEVTYGGEALPVVSSTDLKVSWSGSRQLHVIPAEGCKIDNVVFFDATWQEESTLNVNDDGTFDQKIDYTQAYGKITIYTSGESSTDPVIPLVFDLDDGAFDAITSVKINGVAAERGWEAGLDVKRGAQVAISLNRTDFKIDLFEVNGSESDAEFTVEESTTVTVRAHRYSAIGATLIIDNIDAVKLYEGTSVYDRKPITITDGIFHFTVDERRPVIMIEPTSEFRILSLTDGNGIELNPTSIEVCAGMVINIVSETIVRDMQAMLFVEGLVSASEYSLTGATGHVFKLAEGYQTVWFANEDLPVELYIRGEFENIARVFVNGEEHAGTFFGWRHKLSLNDGDQVLAYVNGVDDPYPVTISGNVSDSFTVTRHMGEPVDDYASFAMLHGTVVTINPVGSSNLKVTATVTDTNDNMIETHDVAADADGGFRIAILAPTDITVTDSSSSIESIVDDGAGEAVYYDLQGNRLPKAPVSGLYIEQRGTSVSKIMAD